MHKDEFSSLAQAVAEHLDGTYTPGHLNGGSISTEGVSFYIRSEGGRLHINGDWPRIDKGNEIFRPGRYEPAAPQISVSAKRSANDIAKDIARRFLPSYTPIYLEQLQRRDERLAYDQRIAELRQHFLNHVPQASIPSDYSSDRLYLNGEDVFIGKDYFSVGRFSIKWSGLEDFAALVRNHATR